MSILSKVKVRYEDLKPELPVLPDFVDTHPTLDLGSKLKTQAVRELWPNNMMGDESR